jgi:hypothetical protein
MRRLLYRAVNFDAAQTGWFAVHAFERRFALQDFRKSGTAGLLQRIAAELRNVRGLA